MNTMQIEPTSLPGLLLITPELKEDARGNFAEIYRADVFAKHGLPFSVVQINHSHSLRNVLRGLHVQMDPPLGKVVRVTAGEAFVAAVDVRRDSPTLGQWFGVSLTPGPRQMLFVPAGFAIGFCVTGETADVEYLCDALYNPRGDTAIRFDDPDIGIRWPVANPTLSERDQHAESFAQWLSRGK